MTVLDTPVRSSLLGPHAAYAVWSAGAVRYDPGMSPFAALPDDPDPADWAGLAELLRGGPSDGGGAGGAAHSQAGDGGGALFDPPALPDGWRRLRQFDAVQMVAEGRGTAAAPDDPQVVRLGADDLADVLDLVARTEPGPFARRTMELGAFLGIRVDGHLVAMAGERMRPEGWTEVSAVCTDPAYRGRGLAGRLVRAVTAGIHARGEGAVLHVLATNPGAISVYEAVGFERRRTAAIVAVRPPGP